MGHAILGVAPDDSVKYKPDEDGMFVCLNASHVRIPMAWVNDDYCDCPDGSDEPGTGACPNGRMYCANKGHFPAFISSRKVGDGVCDYDLCCDGSDEAPGLCPNRCAELNKAYIEEETRKNRILENGWLLRQRLVKDAAKKKNELERELSKHNEKLTNYNQKLQVAREKLENAEIKSAASQGSELATLLSSAKEALRKAYEAAEASWQRSEKISDQLQDLEEILSTMEQDHNPNFNDMAVKAAINNFHDVMSNKIEVATLRIPDDLEAQLAILSEIESKVMHSNGGSGIRGWLIRHSILPRPVDPADLVESARESVDSLTQEVKRLEEQIKEAQEQLIFDYGADDVFRSLRDHCLKSRISDYDYEICYFKQATQMGTGHHASLGRFDRVIYGDRTATFIYENGAQCWNGPKRRATVVVICGEDEELVSVTEPEKCDYRIEVLSPIVCTSPNNSEQGIEPARSEPHELLLERDQPAHLHTDL